jgi:hypothetical protein
MKKARKTKTQRKPATSTTFKLGSDVPRHPKAARTKRWEAMVAYRKKNPRATLEQVIGATSYTRSDYRLDIARGSLKA